MMPVHNNNNNHMVEGSVERGRAVPVGARPERYDKSMAVAAIVQSIPWFIWAAPVVIIFGFIIMALVLNHDSHSLKSFIGSVTFWLSVVPIVGGVGLAVYSIWWCYRFYHQYMLDASNRRLVKATEQKAVAAARNAELKNDLLQADIDLRQQIPQVILALTQTGVAFKYDAKGTLEVLGQAGRVGMNQVTGVQEVGAGAQAAIAGPVGELPIAIRYEDVRDRIPEGHSLLGVSSNGGVETCDFAQLMTMWICGGSSTGKSNTVGIKIEEAIAYGKDLGIICIDYHARKSDSLYNKIRAYEDRFLMPVAYTEEAALVALQYFLTEFTKRRDVGNGARDILLVVDEVPAVLESEDEEIVRLLKKIARICGRESRGFGMFGWFISQNAVGLAWLRNVVLTVIAHKMNMLNEAVLACNQHQDIARDMENWPRGRVIVYGLSFQGFKVLQMPLLSTHLARSERKSPVVEATDERVIAASAVTQKVEVPEEEKSDSPSPVPALTGDLRKVYDAVQYMLEAGGGFNAREIAQVTGFGKDKANGLLNRLADLGYIQRRKAV